MRRHTLLVAVIASYVLSACGSSQTGGEPPAPPTPAPAVAAEPVEPAEPAAPPTAPPTEPTPTAGESKEGTVVFEALEPIKSVRSYTGAELFLEANDERVVLRPTEKVTRDQLVTLAGKRVRVTVAWTEGHDPDPTSQAPMGPDGKAMKQGAGWRVLAVEQL
jgi:hypothetical protein